MIELCYRCWTGYTGLLPMFDEYDRENVTEYLDAHADGGAKLTPTLAHKFPDLADRYGACNWSCPRCSETFTWDTVDWDGDTSNPPFCPNCIADDSPLFWK